MLPRRLLQLLLGLTLYGVSLALMLRANLGLDPWDVFHQGLARHLGWSIGTVVNVMGAVVLLLWWPIRQRPGLGTVLNVLVVGSVVDVTLSLLPPASSLTERIILLPCGVLLNAVATAAYIGARLGPGPRDGLMTGLVRRTGRPVRVVRTAIELSVLAAGWLLGGSVGVGTVAYALLIGPLVQPLLPLFAVPETSPIPQEA
ncbi:YitT family protein [Deinococcus sonorensis]|uniref:YitT family protein n=2 Tax=Deinococcus sonorensis TaxID=309891 RepID=A0AAU7UF98_9DEIO